MTKMVLMPAEPPEDLEAFDEVLFDILHADGGTYADVYREFVKRYGKETP